MSIPKPAIKDLECDRGVDFCFSFSVTGGDGAKFNFYGAKAWLTVYRDQAKAVEFLKLDTEGGSIAIENFDENIVVNYPAENTALLLAGGYIYDLDIEFLNGSRWRFFTGNFAVNAGSLA